LAKERGSFPAFDYEGFSKSAFFKTLPLRIRKDIKQYGIRNVTLLTQPPVGTTGTMVGYSQGPEPYYGLVYQRNSRVGTFIDGSPAFQTWLKDNDIDYSDFNYSLAELKKEHEVPEYFVEAHEVHPEDHIKMQAVFAKYIDSSVSKTVNLPSYATVEDVEQAYLLAYQLGIKGTTVYRDGSKEQICERLKKTAEETRPGGIISTAAPKRPKELACDIHNTSVKGERWTVLVGLMDGKPYEVFCAQEESFEIPSKYKTGTLVKAASGKYHLDLNGIKLKHITAQLESDEHRVITRLISTSLRHGVPLDFINDQLQKAQGTVTDFSKAILRVLKKYSKEADGEILGTQCPICTGRNVIRSGGCPSCLDCGWSKCE
jgi:ribonucleoside-diphosphate reductase alpha chain